MDEEEDEENEYPMMELVGPSSSQSFRGMNRNHLHPSLGRSWGGYKDSLSHTRDPLASKFRNEI
jgi:hypothetical protein